jgi:hypothetical protein
MDHRWCRIRADLNAVVNNLLGLAKTHGEFWAFESKTLNAEPSPKVRDGVDTNRDWLKNVQMSALSPRAYRRSIAGVCRLSGCLRIVCSQQTASIAYRLCKRTCRFPTQKLCAYQSNCVTVPPISLRSSLPRRASNAHQSRRATSQNMQWCARVLP